MFTSCGSAQAQPRTFCRTVRRVAGAGKVKRSSRGADVYKRQEHGLSVPDEYVPEAPYLEAEASADVTKKLLALKNPPTCILYPDDYTAIGGIAVIREAGLSIPSDISVAGYDGISLIQQFQPKLTTYAQDMSGIGKAARCV